MRQCSRQADFAEENWKRPAPRSSPASTEALAVFIPQADSIAAQRRPHWASVATALKPVQASRYPARKELVACYGGAAPPLRRRSRPAKASTIGDAAGVIMATIITHQTSAIVANSAGPHPARGETNKGEGALMIASPSRPLSIAENRVSAARPPRTARRSRRSRAMSGSRAVGAPSPVGVLERRIEPVLFRDLPAIAVILVAELFRTRGDRREAGSDRQRMAADCYLARGPLERLN